MKKYYYSDPLAAAWMAKAFCMKFEEAYMKPYCNGALFLDAWDHQDYEGMRFTIEIDSLHLLEPQVGDAWLSDHGLGKVQSPASGRRCAEQMKDDNAIIVQRNGVAFIWPEVEAA